jgi:hypothetical protein
MIDHDTSPLSRYWSTSSDQLVSVLTLEDPTRRGREGKVNHLDADLALLVTKIRFAATNQNGSADGRGAMCDTWRWNLSITLRRQSQSQSRSAYEKIGDMVMATVRIEENVQTMYRQAVAG